MSTFGEFPSLKELLAAVVAGIERAVKELGRRYNGLVCGYTLSLLRVKGCNDPADHSREIINSAWFAILRHLDQLKDCDSFEGWVKKIIFNLVSQHVSGPNGCISQQKKTEQLRPTQDSGIERVEKKMESSVWVNEMVDLAYKQSSMFGEIVRLHFVEGLTLEEVAEELGHSYAKVHSFYYRNMRVFVKLFKGDREGNGGGADSGGDSGSSYVN